MTLPKFINFTPTTVQVAGWACGICNSTKVKVVPWASAGVVQATCLNCGTVEYNPPVPAIAQQATQATFTPPPVGIIPGGANPADPVPAQT
jgi:hypothetical protein